MAVTFDTVSTSSNATDPTSLTWSHTTTTNNNRVLVVGTSTESDTGGHTAQTVSGITYAGVTLTKIRSDYITDNGTELWYLIAPATGVNNVVVTMTAVVDGLYGAAMTFSEVDQTSPIDANAGTTATNTSISQSLTTIAHGAMIVNIMQHQNSASVHSPDANQTQRFNAATTGDFSSGGGTRLVTTATSYTTSWTTDISDAMTLSVVSLKPAPLTTSWTVSSQIVSDPTKVSGASDLTNFPVLIKDGNIPDSVYGGLHGELGSYTLGSDANLNAYWKMQGNSNDTTANANNGTDTAITYSSTAGRFNQGATFNGTSSKIIVADSASVSLTGSWTIGCWAYLTVNNATQPLIEKYDVTAGNPNAYLVRVNSSGKIFCGNGNATSFDSTPLTGTTTVTTATWHFIVCTWDGTNYRAYLDGVLDKTQTGTMNPTDGGTSLKIGQVGDGGATYFNGYIDDAFIFSRQLSGDEILSLYGTNAKDFRITTDSAGTTEIPYEIVSMDTTAKTAEVWAKVPTLLTASATSLYLWAGNANAIAYDANAPFGSQAVWGSTYKRVLHLQETVNNTASGYIDSTSNAGHGTGTSMALTAPEVQIKNGQDFDGTADYITLTDHADLEQATGTAHFWFQNDILINSGIADYQYLFDKGDTYIGIRFSKAVGHEGKIEFILYDGSAHYARSATTSWSANAKHHLVATWGAAGMKLYIDGALDGSDAHTGGYTNVANNIDLARNTANKFYFNGKLDEWRFISAQNSSDWIATEYANQNDPSTFWTQVSGVRLLSLLGCGT